MSVSVCFYMNESDCLCAERRTEEGVSGCRQPLTAGSIQLDCSKMEPVFQAPCAAGPHEDTDEPGY